MLIIVLYSITNLLVYSEDPALDVGIMIVRDVINGKDRTVLDGASSIGPECWVALDLARSH